MKTKTMTILTVLLLIATSSIVAAAFHYYSGQAYIELKGDKEVSVGLYGVYEDQGVRAEKGDKDISDKVKISGEVDTTKAGNYMINYRAGNYSVQRQVTVLDRMSPEISLKGDDESKIKLGDKFKEPGYSAQDDKGNDLTDSVKVSDTDFKKAGRQKIEYTVTDSRGNTTKLTRTVTVEPNTSYKTSGIPICMYHYVYDENEPLPANLNANYISVKDLTEEMEWLDSQDYYYPTWKELRAYVDGKLLLPEKSVVITFDDGSYSFLKKGLPVLEKYKIPATSFIITSKHGKDKIEKYKSDYLTFQSHSDNMHRGGGKIGHGGIFTVISHDEGMADLEKSIEITGSKDAFAYPFGDNNESSRKMVEEAGFLCAVTTVQGRAKPGDDPYSLHRQRMSRGQTMETFRALVLPF